MQINSVYIKLANKIHIAYIYNNLLFLQLIPKGQILQRVPSCPWGPRDHLLLWILVGHLHPGYKDKRDHRNFLFKPLFCIQFFIPQL